MLQRLASADECLQDHELLEILLFNAIPRKNTNEIAHNLLSTFGSLSALFRADFDALNAVDGVGASTAAYLRCIALFYERLKFSPVKKSPSAYNFEKFSAFLDERFHGLDAEYIELYAADTCGNIGGVARISSRETDRVRIKPEEISDFISKHHPAALIAAHNHLINNCTPSASDDRFTEQVQLMCDLLNVRFYDHVIVSPCGKYSYYACGKLQSIKEAFNVKALFPKSFS